MQKVIDLNAKQDRYVHYEGCRFIGSHTLCGITDIIGATFISTTRRVDCPGCRAVADHVCGRKAKERPNEPEGVR